MKRFVFPITIESGDKWGFVVTFPDIPFAVTQGDDLEDAKRQADDCLDEAIAAMIKNNWDIPYPSTGGHAMASTSVPMAAKAYLYLALRESELSKEEIEERLNWDSNAIVQLLDPQKDVDFIRIETALAILGKKLNLELVDAA